MQTQTTQVQNQYQNNTSQETPVACSRSSWTALLEAAVRTPGLLHEAYQAFHRYSLGNQVLAIEQCNRRKLSPGPINTYVGWQKLGRHVIKGEKALTLCMPVTSKKRAEEQAGPVQDGAAPEPEAVSMRFMLRPYWFVLSQTEGEPYVMPSVPAWEQAAALANLGVQEVAFESIDGNTQGYAQGSTVAINPVAALPHKTMFHELAHIILGHTKDDATETKELREAEAESVALLVNETLGLPGSEYSRGYLQHWLSGDKIPERSAQKIFGAADRILKAGTVQPADPPEDSGGKAPCRITS